jgi:tetratricopeptide (TPR) repeat protein
LQTAAVVGHEVPLALVQAIVGLPAAELHRGLAHLQAAEFLYETRLYPEHEFTFKHALTHEVAYGSLLQERRRMLHGRIVEELETLYTERLAEQVDRLAHHAVRGEVWEKALSYCQQAGARAMAGSAHREAVVYFEQALAALAQLPESRDTLEQGIDLRCDLRNALLPLGEQARMLDHLRAAEPLAERLGDDRRRGRVAGHLCISFYSVNEYAHAIAAGQRALALGTDSGALDVMVPAQTALAGAYLTVGDFREALDVSQQAMALLTGDLRYAHFGRLALPAVTSRRYAAFCLAELGEVTAGRRVGEEAVQLAEAVEHPYSIVLALAPVGVLCRRQGEIHTAIPVLERGLALCQSANIPLHVPLLASSLGAAYVLARRAAEARPLLDQALERLATSSFMGTQPIELAELSEALLLVGRVEEASELASRLLELSRTHTGHGHQAHAYHLLGEVARQRDVPEVAEAEAHFRRALTLADELGMRPLQAHCHHGLGKLYRHTGRLEPARAELTTAMHLYRSMDMTFWLPEAEAALAQLEE